MVFISAPFSTPEFETVTFSILEFMTSALTEFVNTSVLNEPPIATLEVGFNLFPVAIPTPIAT